jgi:hypothetical protein
MATGTFCGPPPGPGNGLGPGGLCTGAERVPPCGPGVVPGVDYPYTMPGTCDGRIWFDGKQWDSELPPPTPVAAFYVYMSESTNGTVGFIAPVGAVGFTPDSAASPPPCRG